MHRKSHAVAITESLHPTATIYIFFFVHKILLWAHQMWSIVILVDRKNSKFSYTRSWTNSNLFAFMINILVNNNGKFETKSQHCILQFRFKIFLFKPWCFLWWRFFIFNATFADVVLSNHSSEDERTEFELNCDDEWTHVTLRSRSKVKNEIKYNEVLHQLIAISVSMRRESKSLNLLAIPQLLKYGVSFNYHHYPILLSTSVPILSYWADW